MSAKRLATYGVPEAGALAGLGSYASYKAARERIMPTIKIGRLLRVPKKKWDRILNGEEPIPEPMTAAPQAPASGEVA